jgi:hypothetical protein
MRRLFLSATTATILVIGPSASHADDALPAFAFRGHQIGESIDANFPYWAQGYRGLDRKSSHSLPYCDKADNGTVTCTDMTVDNVGGAEIIAFNYKFFNGKLFSATMSFYTAYYSEVRGLLGGKYGNPTAERSEPVQNLAGATFDNIVTEWKFREGVLKLQMRFGEINTGILIFENPTVDHEVYTRDIQRLQEQGKKAF